MAYYVLEENQTGLRLKPDSKEKKTLAVLGITAGALLLAMSAYSLMRSERDLTGFVAWLAIGTVLIGASLAYLTFRTEIEVDPGAGEIVRRRYGPGGKVKLSGLEFTRVKTVKAVEEKHASSGDVPEHSFGKLKIIAADGAVWAQVRMSSAGRAGKARKQILALIEGR